MGVEGSEYYSIYKHLNAKIIKPAVKEINKTANIVVEPEIRKRGRAVTDIRFKISENPQLAILDLDDGTGVRRSDVYAHLQSLGVSDRLARQWIAEHGEDHVADKITYVGAQRGVKNLVGYLSVALKEDFAAEGEAAPVSSERAKILERVRDLVAAGSPTQRDGWVSALNSGSIKGFWHELVPEAFEG